MTNKESAFKTKDTQRSKNTLRIISNNGDSNFKTANSNIMCYDYSGDFKQNSQNKKLTFSLTNIHNDHRQNITKSHDKNNYFSPKTIARKESDESSYENQEALVLPHCKTFSFINGSKKLNITDIEKSLLSQNHTERLTKNMKILFHSKTEKNNFRFKNAVNRHSDRLKTYENSANMQTQTSTNKEDPYIMINENKKVFQNQFKGNNIASKADIKQNIRKVMTQTTLRTKNKLNQKMSMQNIKHDSATDLRSGNLFVSVLDKSRSPKNCKTKCSHEVEQKESESSRMSKNWKMINQTVAHGDLNIPKTKKCKHLKTEDILQKINKTSSMSQKQSLLDILGQKKEKERLDKLLNIVKKYTSVINKQIGKIREKIASRKQVNTKENEMLNQSPKRAINEKQKILKQKNSSNQSVYFKPSESISKNFKSPLFQKLSESVLKQSTNKKGTNQQFQIRDLSKKKNNVFNVCTDRTYTQQLNETTTSKQTTTDRNHLRNSSIEAKNGTIEENLSFIERYNRINSINKTSLVFQPNSKNENSNQFENYQSLNDLGDLQSTKITEQDQKNGLERKSTVIIGSILKNQCKDDKQKKIMKTITSESNQDYNKLCDNDDLDNDQKFEKIVEIFKTKKKIKEWRNRNKKPALYDAEMRIEAEMKKSLVDNLLMKPLKDAKREHTENDCKIFRTYATSLKAKEEIAYLQRKKYWKDDYVDAKFCELNPFDTPKRKTGKKGTFKELVLTECTNLADIDEKLDRDLNSPILKKCLKISEVAELQREALEKERQMIGKRKEMMSKLIAEDIDHIRVELELKKHERVKALQNMYKAQEIKETKERAQQSFGEILLSFQSTSFKDNQEFLQNTFGLKDLELHRLIESLQTAFSELNFNECGNHGSHAKLKNSNEQNLASEILEGDPKKKRKKDSNYNIEDYEFFGETNLEVNQSDDSLISVFESKVDRLYSKVNKFNTLIEFLDASDLEYKKKALIIKCCIKLREKSKEDIMDVQRRKNNEI